MLEYKLEDFIGYKANETIDNLFFLLNDNAHYRNSYERRLVHVNYKGTEFSLKQWKTATSWGNDGISAEDFLKIEVKGSVLGDAYVKKIIPTDDGIKLVCTDDEYDY
jgi:hypothetical protein